MTAPQIRAPRMYTPGQVAEMFRVSPTTVARWAQSGKLPPATRTLGNHRHFDADLVDKLLRGES